MNLANSSLFTPKNRLKAIAQETVRALSDLYYPYTHSSIDPRNLKRKSTIRKIGRTAAKVTEFAPTNAAYDGKAASTFIEINPKFSTTFSDRPQLRKLMVHEAIHRLPIATNDLVTPSAFSEYFYSSNMIHQKLIHEALSQPKGNEVIRSIEEAFSRKFQIFVALSRMKLSNMSTKQHNEILQRTEHEPFFGNKSQAEIGNLLGQFALAVEEQFRSPGLGLILIREVSMGKGMAAVLEEIKAHKYTREVRSLFSRNPLLKRITQKTHQRARTAFIAEKRIQRAKQKNIQKQFQRFAKRTHQFNRL